MPFRLTPQGRRTLILLGLILGLALAGQLIFG